MGGTEEMLSLHATSGETGDVACASMRYSNWSLKFEDTSVESAFQRLRLSKHKPAHTRWIVLVDFAALMLTCGLQQLQLHVEANSHGGTVHKAHTAAVWVAFAVVTALAALFELLSLPEGMTASLTGSVALHSSLANSVTAVLCGFFLVHALGAPGSPFPQRTLVTTLLMMWEHLSLCLLLPINWTHLLVSMLACGIVVTAGSFALLMPLGTVSPRVALQCVLTTWPVLLALFYWTRRKERRERKDFVALSLLEAQHEETAKEERRYEAILGDILPAGIASKLKQIRHMEKSLSLAESTRNLPHHVIAPLPQNELEEEEQRQHTIAETHSGSTVGFITIDGLDSLMPERLVQVLGQLFTSFDMVAARFDSVLKIKTTGTTVMFVAGLNSSLGSALQATNLCVQMRKCVKAFSRSSIETPDVSCRAGLSTGATVSGVVGKNKPKYDVWGDTVNVSARLMQHCPHWGVQISECTRSALGDCSAFSLKPSEAAAKGKGILRTYLVEERGSESADSLVPGDLALLQPSPEPVTPNSAISVNLREIITQKTGGGPSSGTSGGQILASFQDFSQLPMRKELASSHAQNPVTLQFKDDRVEAKWNRYHYRKAALGGVVRAQFVAAFLANAAACVFDYFYSVRPGHGSRWLCLLGLAFWAPPALSPFFSRVSCARRSLKYLVVACALLSHAYVIAWMFAGLYWRIPAFVLVNAVSLHLLCHAPYFPSAVLTVVAFPICVAAVAVALPGCILEAVLLVFFLDGLSCVLHFLLEKQSRRKFSLSALLQREKERLRKEESATKDLLLSVLPASLLDKLASGTRSDVIAQSVPEASVLFADIVGFTAMCSSLPAYDVIRLLESVFSIMDRVVEVHNLEKLKTVGDAYIAVSNVSVSNDTHANDVVAAGLDILSAIKRLNQQRRRESRVAVRIGINTGPLLAGVIQTKSYIFDCWGATLDVADRLQATGSPNTCHVSQATYLKTRERFPYEPCLTLACDASKTPPTGTTTTATSTSLEPVPLDRSKRDSVLGSAPTYTLTQSIVVTATLGGLSGLGHPGHRHSEAKHFGVMKSHETPRADILLDASAPSAAAASATKSSGISGMDPNMGTQEALSSMLKAAEEIERRFPRQKVAANKDVKVARKTSLPMSATSQFSPVHRLKSLEGICLPESGNSGSGTSGAAACSSGTLTAVKSEPQGMAESATDAVELSLSRSRSNIQF